MRKVFTDQIGRIVEVPFPPGRIVSLVPSQTEWLYDLGLDEEVVGITKFCIHPEHWYRTKTRVGGTKQLHLDIIRKLQPDLILANREENEKSQLEELMPEFPVWVSDIYTLADALQMMLTLGEMTQRETRAKALVQQICIAFEKLEKRVSSRQVTLRAAYFIWYRPWMVAASHTFIDHLLQRCGFQNAFAHLERYPQVEASDIMQVKPELILLSSEPFPFKAIHQQALQSLLPEAACYFVDGEMFSWYGSRLLYAPDYFEILIDKIISQSNP